MKQRINVTLPEEIIEMLRYTCSKVNTNMSQLITHTIMKSSLKTAYDKMRLLERSGVKCQCCGRDFSENELDDEFEAIHIVYDVPLEDGGEDVLSNKKIVCEECSAKDWFLKRGYHVDVQIDKMTDEAKVAAVKEDMDYKSMNEMLLSLNDKIKTLESDIEDMRETIEYRNPAYISGILIDLVQRSKYGILPISQYNSVKDAMEEFEGNPLFYDDKDEKLPLIHEFYETADGKQHIVYFEGWGDADELGFTISVNENNSEDGNDTSGAYIVLDFGDDLCATCLIQDGRCVMDVG